jgi:hypothetical protein
MNRAHKKSAYFAENNRFVEHCSTLLLQEMQHFLKGILWFEWQVLLDMNSKLLYTKKFYVLNREQWCVSCVKKNCLFCSKIVTTGCFEGTVLLWGNALLRDYTFWQDLFESQLLIEMNSESLHTKERHTSWKEYCPFCNSIVTLRKGCTFWSNIFLFEQNSASRKNAWHILQEDSSQCPQGKRALFPGTLHVEKSTAFLTLSKHGNIFYILKGTLLFGHKLMLATYFPKAKL